MPLIIKNIQVNWSWSGDTEALKGFNVCLCKSTDTPLTATTAFVYISDINSRSYIFRNITIDTGVTYEPYVQAVYDGKDSDWVKTSGGSIADDGINTIPIKLQVDTAATTATWDGVTGKPDTLSPPIGSGLYLSSTRMGYYDTGDWKTYIDNAGNFKLGNVATGKGIDWNQNNGTLTIKGTLDAQDINASGFTAQTINIADAAITNAKINDLSVSKLTTGTINSKQLILSVTDGQGDAVIKAGKSDFDDIENGFILGIDDSDSNKTKFEIGNKNNYLKWNGSSLNIAGSINVLAGSNIQPGATSNKTFNQSSDPILYHPTFTRDTTSYKMNGTLILNNKPRIESGLFGGAIMIEEGVVNLFTSPNNLSDAIWIKTGNNTPVLDNTIIPTNTNIQHFFLQDRITTSGKQYTISFECKSSGYNFVQITGSTGFPPAVVNIDISAASIVWNPNAESKIRVNKTQDGWCRIEYTLTSNSSSLSRMIVAVINNNNQSRLPTWTGDGISGVKFRNMQFEQNLIATSFHESTRNSEILTIPTNGVTPSAGTIEMWIYINDKTKITDYTNNRIVFIAGETVGYGGYIALMHDKNTPYWYMAARRRATGTLTNSSMIADSTTPTGWNHFAVTWDSISGARLYINGIDTGATIATSSLPDSFGNGTFEIGQISNSTIRHINTLFDSICLSNYKKTQAELLESATSGLPISRNSGTVGLYEFDNHISWIDGSTLRTYNGVSWDSAATLGATLGTNLFKSDGTKVTTITSEGIYTGTLEADQIRSLSFISKGSYLTTSCSAGTTTLNVKNTIDFPISGSGWIYDTNNDKDEISWTGKTSSTLTGVSGALDHTVNAIIVPKAPIMTFDSKSQEFRILGYNTLDNTYSTVDQLVTLGIKDVGDGGAGTYDTAIARFGNPTHSRGLAAYFENNKASSSTFTAETVRIENFNCSNTGYTSYGLTVNNCHYNGIYDPYAVGIFTRGIKFGLHSIIGGITGVIPIDTNYAICGYAYGTGKGGVFESASGEGVWGIGGTNGVNGYGITRDFYATGPGTNYASFTGSHDALVKKDTLINESDIVEDICIVNIASSTQTISEIGITNTIKSKKVIGVMGSREKFNQNSVPVGLKVFFEDSDIPDYNYIEKTYDCCLIHALGEGVINVCNDGGNIYAGDYICSSSRPGKGMRQDDDLLHNYTVAKAREDCIWLDGEDDIRTIACIYHCG